MSGGRFPKRIYEVVMDNSKGKGGVKSARKKKIENTTEKERVKVSIQVESGNLLG